jgi:hypothetical protein
MKVRIVRVPPGEAPLEVREAWVGLVLPLARGFEGPRSIMTAGVLSAPATFLGTLLGWFMGRVRRADGFVVDAAAAIDILAVDHPDAAAWWRTNTPGLLRPGRRFLFHAEACEPVQEQRETAA